MKNLKIAIIGAGTAGLAAAAFLHQSGHHPIIFEKFEEPKPLGAGLLIQPIGLAVLSKLGLDKYIIEKGSIIRELYGKEAGGKLTIMDVRYSDMASHLFGVGTHRGTLFSALYNKVKELGIEVKSSSEIIDAEQLDTKVNLININNEKFTDFDMVIDSSGQKSAIRNKYADIKLNKQYPYAAIWSTVKLPEGFKHNILAQKYKGASNMIGILPVGKLDGQNMSAVFFCNMKAVNYSKWREQDLSIWKEYVKDLWPETAEILQQFKTHDDLAFTTYSDTVLNKYHNDKIIFIGDSAHCTSPQLGQGANLALMDAFILTECLNEALSIEEAFNSYNKKRKAHIDFYQIASRWLTPFFQSDSWVFGKLRYLLCALPCKVPITRKIAANVLSGSRTGMFSTINPGIWSKDYDLFKSPSKTFIESSS